ncbi:hypothetical protein A0256_15160 [Mucilaginibacter sp. PAMC 26640]|nr:hypothetical protein A0256_15160 [Mucilaginibacter sp. PAMC 26640]
MNPANNDIRLLLVVGIAAMLMLFISFLIIFILSQRKKLQYQQEVHVMQKAQQFHLVEAAVRSEETERQRIAEELHDEVGALLASSKLHFRMIEIEKVGADSKVLYEKGNTLLDEAISKIRGISHTLHSYILKEFGLNEAIKHFTEKLSDNSAVAITTSLDDSYTTLIPQNDLAIYRITQELLNNIFKYASPTIIRISSVYNNNILVLKVIHNGAGLTQQVFEELRYISSGLGLKNIQNRIYLLQGEITFIKEDTTYAIQITIPTLTIN